MLQTRVYSFKSDMGLFNTHLKFKTLFQYLTLKNLMCVTGPISYSLSNTLAEELLRHTGSAHPDSKMGLRVCEEEDMTSCLSIKYNHLPSKEEKLYHASKYTSEMKFELYCGQT